MEVSINLRQVLRDYGLDTHGIINTLAAELAINRDTASRLCSGKATSISFAHLGRLCTWLAARKVPEERLPAILFERQRATLWESLGRHSDRITIYLGEYQTMLNDQVTGRWISRRDSQVAANLIKVLSQKRPMNELSALELSYVPFHYSPHDPHVDLTNLEEDIRKNAEIFNQMKHSSRPESSIIIGSQRVNYQLEFFLADLFNCPAFPRSPGKKPVPLFSVYRKLDQNTPSCFGGTKNPYIDRSRQQPGIHYMRDTGRWGICPWIQDKQDAAVVITVNDHERRSITLAVFGYTGRATEAVGDLLVTCPDLFWPPATQVNRKEVGLYIYQFKYTATGKTEPATSRDKTGSSVIRIKESVIKALVKA